MSSIQRLQGTIRKLGIEGGLWALITEEGKSVHLIDPPQELCTNGLRVEVEGTQDGAEVTIGMVGKALVVQGFRRL